MEPAGGYAYESKDVCPGGVVAPRVPRDLAHHRQAHMRLDAMAPGERPSWKFFLSHYGLQDIVLCGTLKMRGADEQDKTRMLDSIVSSVHRFCKFLEMDVPDHPQYNQMVRSAAEEEIRAAAASLSSPMANTAQGA